MAHLGSSSCRGPRRRFGSVGSDRCGVARTGAMLLPISLRQSSARGGGGMLGNYEYDALYKGIPLSSASSATVVTQRTDVGEEVICIRYRNILRENATVTLDPTVTLDDASRLGQTDARDVLADLPGKDVALTVDRPADAKAARQILVTADGNGRLTLSFVVRSTDKRTPFARRYWVAAQDQATILAKEDLIYRDEPAPINGKVTGIVWGFHRSPFDSVDTGKPLRNLYVVQGTQKFRTGDQGDYQIITPGLDAPTAALSGPFCRIITLDADGNVADGLVPKKIGTNFEFNADAEEVEKIAQVSAFFWVNEAHEFVKDALSGSPDTPDKLTEVPTFVNVPDKCNAFWSRVEHSLNFFRPAPPPPSDPKARCPSTACCDVVCHEYGHGVDDHFGGIRDGGLSEGTGDSLAILITRDSVVGRDFHGQGKHLRDAKDPVTWPDVRNAEVHTKGKAYAGFTWDLTKKLIDRFGGDEDEAFEIAKKLTLGSVANNPKDIPDAIRWTFFVDFKAGSKFQDQIKVAAKSRKIPIPKDPGDLSSPLINP